MPDEQGQTAGLCGRCVHARRVHTDRGSVFYLCERSLTDPRFPKYPILPVNECPGFEPEKNVRGDTQH